MLSVLQDACLLSLASHTPNLGAGCSHEPSWISHSTPLGYFSQTEEAGTDTRVQSPVPKGKAGTDPELLEFIFSAHGLGRAPNVPGIDHHHCNFTSHCSILGALPVNLPWFCPWISDKPCWPPAKELTHFSFSAGISHPLYKTHAFFTFPVVSSLECGGSWFGL